MVPKIDGRFLKKKKKMPNCFAPAGLLCFCVDIMLKLMKTTRKAVFACTLTLTRRWAGGGISPVIYL